MALLLLNFILSETGAKRPQCLLGVTQMCPRATRISLPHFSDYKEWGMANHWPTRSIFVPGVPLDLPETCWQIGESSVFIEIAHESLID